MSVEEEGSTSESDPDLSRVVSSSTSVVVTADCEAGGFLNLRGSMSNSDLDRVGHCGSSCAEKCGGSTSYERGLSPAPMENVGALADGCDSSDGASDGASRCTDPRRRRSASCSASGAVERSGDFFSERVRERLGLPFLDSARFRCPGAFENSEPVRDEGSPSGDLERLPALGARGEREDLVVSAPGWQGDLEARWWEGVRERREAREEGEEGRVESISNLGCSGEVERDLAPSGEVERSPLERLVGDLEWYLGDLERCLWRRGDFDFLEREKMREDFLQGVRVSGEISSEASESREARSGRLRGGCASEASWCGCEEEGSETEEVEEEGVGL